MRRTVILNAPTGARKAFDRLWDGIVAVSKVAVRRQYHAPWMRPDD